MSKIKFETVQHPLIDPQDPGVALAWIASEIAAAAVETGHDANDLLDEVERMALRLDAEDLRWWEIELEGIAESKRTHPDVAYTLLLLRDRLVVEEDEENYDDLDPQSYVEWCREHRAGMC